MDLVVITVSYNTRDLLADCLDSVLAGLQRSSLEGQAWGRWPDYSRGRAGGAGAQRRPAALRRPREALEAGADIRARALVRRPSNQLWYRMTTGEAMKIVE